MNKNPGPAPPARGLTICLSYGPEPDRDRAAGNCLEAPGGGGQRPTSRPPLARPGTEPGGRRHAARRVARHPSNVHHQRAGLKPSVTGRMGAFGARDVISDTRIWCLLPLEKTY
jgi:hypothetical protein